MSRFRVLFPILVVVSVMAAPAARASTIEVTTSEDIVLDGDDLCSIREAVTASIRADTIRQRTTGRSQIVADRTVLQGQLPRLRTRPEETYSRASLVAMIDLLKREVEEHETPAPALLADINELLEEIDPPEPAPTPPNPNLDEVERAIELQNRVIARIDAELEVHRDRDEVDGCIDGSAFDVILLGEDTYLLDAELALDRRTTVRGQGSDKTFLQTASGSGRLFRILEGASLELSGAGISGGNLGCSGTDTRGGAVFVSGTFKGSKLVFHDNQACDGGAIHVADGGSLELTETRLYDNQATNDGGAIHALSGVILTDVAFGDDGTGDLVPVAAPNIAGNRGGAVYLQPVDEVASLTVIRGAFLFNEAMHGSAIYIGGVNPLVTLENVTFGENEAGERGVISIESTAMVLDRFLFNNVSLLNNRVAAGASGTGGLYVSQAPGLRLSNSLLAGNAVSDCDLDGVTAGMDPGALNAFEVRFSRNYYGAASGCPGRRGGDEPEYLNYELDAGVDPVGYLVQPLNAAGVYVPVYPDNDAQILLVNRGASTQDPNRCAEKDQRNLDRVSFVDVDCDIGAVEYQLGRRADDSVEIIVDQPVCIDVAIDDIGDAFYLPGSLGVLDIERAGARAVVLFRDPDGDGNTDDDQIGQCPNADAINAADPAAARDVILFTPPPGFRGETIVTYSLSWTTQGSEPVQGTVSGFSRVFTESAGGISSSKLGAVSPFSLLLLGLVAFRRRARAALALVFLALVAVPAHAATESVIYVNSGMDPVAADGTPLLTPGDGKCTLREALNTARNDQANLTGGDCVNGNEGPDIIEFVPPDENFPEPDYLIDDEDEPVVRLVINLGNTVTSYGGVTLRCPTRLAPDNRRYECVIRPDPDSPRTFSLINSEGSIGVLDMILENGDAGTGNGGAINSRGGVNVVRSVLRNNTARTGGGVFLRGVRSDLYISQSTFVDNTSTGNADDGVSVREGGGAVATSAGDEHRIQIESSTFTGNRSITSAAALSLKSIRPVVIANSTFTDNHSTAGAAVIDVADTRSSITLRNLTIVENTSGPGFAAIEAFGRSVLLTNSILAANYSGTDDANCGRGSFATTFNLFGESVQTCPLAGVPANSRRETAALVMERLGPLDDNGGPTQTRAPLPEFEGPAATNRWIVDQGYNLTSADDLAAPLETGKPQCATIDQRGVSRASGGRCDIGAYEDQRVTALDDSGSNMGRLDRDVVIDILRNDLFAPDDNKQLRGECDLDAPDLSQAGKVILRNDDGDPCLELIIPEDLDPADFTFIAADDPDLESFYKPTPSPYLLKFVNADRLLISNEEPALIKYRVYTEDGDVSDEADIVMNIENIPPFVFNDVINAPVGGTVTIDVLANDIDHDNYDTGKPDPASLTLIGSNCREEQDVIDFDGDGDVAETYWQCQFGRATIDPVTGVITWVPTNKFNPFTETLTYRVLDSEAEPKEGTGTVTIVMARSTASGGSLLGEDDLSDRLGIDFLGGAGWLMLGLSVLLGLRRRVA